MIQRQLHGARRAFAIWQWGGHVISVSGKPVSDKFAINFRATRLGMFQFLHYSDSGAFADYETIPVTIKGSRRPFGFIIARAQRFHCRKPGEANLDNGRLRPASQENVGVAKFNDSPRFTDSVVCRRTSGDNTHVGPAQVEL